MTMLGLPSATYHLRADVATGISVGGTVAAVVPPHHIFNLVTAVQVAQLIAALIAIVSGGVALYFRLKAARANKDVGL